MVPLLMRQVLVLHSLVQQTLIGNIDAEGEPNRIAMNVQIFG